MVSPSILALASLLHLTTSLFIPESRSLSPKLIHQFPNPTFVENIAIRSSDPTQLLVSIIGSPEIYLLTTTSPKTSTLIHSFPPFSSILGITEPSPNHFYAVVSNFSLAIPSFGIGSSTIHSLDLSAYTPSNPVAPTRQVASLPHAGFLNGLTTLDAKRGLIIAADSSLGAIWLINTVTGSSRILLQEPEMAPPPNSTAVSAASIGINGLHVLRRPSSHSHTSDDDVKEIYFSNTATSVFYRVAVSLSSLTQVGQVEIVKAGVEVDDFALDAENDVAYLASGEVNSVLKLGLSSGVVETVVGGVGEMVVPGTTSVALGKGGKIYVTTNGGIVGPVNGTLTEGGKVVEVDVGY